MSVTPSSTVVGIFRDRAMAEQAIEALYDAGFQREQIRYSMPGNAGSFFEDLKNMFTGNSPADTNGDDLANDLAHMGLSDEEARYYTDEYNNGNTILTVQAPGREHEALSVLHQHGAYNSRVSPGSFSDVPNNGQQPMDDTRPDNYTTPEQNTDIGDWETQRLPRTTTEDAMHNDESASQADVEGDRADTYVPQATTVTPEHEATDQATDSEVMPPEHEATSQPANSEVVTPENEPTYRSANTDGVMPEHDVDHPAAQANGVATGHEDELQQLQSQIRSLQQQLEEAKAQLQAAKEHETQLQTAREREQQLQSSRQQMQDLQAELDATLAELRETQSRIGQYR